MILYDYYRSSAAYRVRIAMHLKGVQFDQHPINLAQGEQGADSYKQVNPQGLVPTLVMDDGTRVSQSNAICEWLEETYPTPRLLPIEPKQRARVRSLVNVVACDIHPIANLRIQKYLENEFEISEDRRMDWVRHWITAGLSAIERELEDSETGAFCHGDTPTLADAYLVPQHYNGVRFGCDLQAFPLVNAIVTRCNALDAFVSAHPDSQPGAPT